MIFVSFSPQVTAQGVKDSKFSGTVTDSTDYVWHGYSKSDENGVFQVNLDYQHEMGLFGCGFPSAPEGELFKVQLAVSGSLEQLFPSVYNTAFS